MSRLQTRRDVLKGAAAVAAAASVGATTVRRASAQGGAARIDGVLRQAVDARDVPGVVAMAATDKGVLYEGAVGPRALDQSAAMTLDTVFRIASMTKAIASVAAMQLVEQGKLKLEEPVPNIDPALGSPQVLDGFDATEASSRQAAHHAAAPADPHGRVASIRTPLSFDPGDKWEYGVNIDWVGRLVEATSGQPLDAYFRDKIFAPLGVTGLIMTQILPFADARAVKLYGQLERGVYDALKA